jgi:hypothetical protein
MNAAELTKALGGMWHRRYGLARCPAHADRSPSLSIGDGDRGKVLVKCHAGCDQSHVIAALRRLDLWPGHAEQPTEAEQEAQRRRDEARERERRRRDAFVERTWQETWRTAVPARGSPIERWLKERGIDPARLDLDRLPLRWAPRCPLAKGTAPAMLAMMTDPMTNEEVGVHRTFLTADGKAKAFGENSRRIVGHAGIIRLSADEDVAEGLGISEGIENGLAVMAAGWQPIWACGSLGMLTAFPVLPGIEWLTIFADPKPHEIEGARTCATRWSAAGREAVVRMPGLRGDWNDVLAAVV